MSQRAIFEVAHGNRQPFVTINPKFHLEPFFPGCCWWLRHQEGWRVFVHPEIRPAFFFRRADG